MQTARGRPRDTSVEQRIEQAVVELLSEAGFAGTSIEGVAQLSGLSRPTIYRRYADRLTMINSVVAELLARDSPPPTDHPDPYENVCRHLKDTIRMLTQTPIGPIYRAVLPELPRHAALAELVNKIGSARRKKLNTAIDRALAAGVLVINGDVDAATDGLVGAIYFRYLMASRALGPGYAEKLLQPYLPG